MYRLIQFFNRYHVFFLFLLLELFCLYLLMDRNHYQRVQYFNSSNRISAGMDQSFTGLTDFFHLKSQNDSLARENARLLEQLQGKVDYLVYKNDSVIDTLNREVYHFSSARIIKKSTHAIRNYITIDKGRLDGLEVEMGVIGPQGIVGIVKSVNEKFSIIMPVIHADFKVSCRLGDYIGSLSWDAIDSRYAQIKDLPQHINLDVGQEVLSSGYSSFFPMNQAIGVIHQIEKPEGGSFYEVDVALSTDFRTLGFVYVVDYLRKTDQQELEQNLYDE